MSKIIEKTVVDKYTPHDTNVDWLDVSGDKPVKKSYINGKWQVISGGGGAGSSGVKIPVPTAEDESKILVVTKVAGDNTSIIVPEQQVPADNETPLTDVDLTKFVVGNTVSVTISENSQTLTATGVIKKDGPVNYSDFDIGGKVFYVAQIDNSLCTNVICPFGPNSTIKLEYIELNYEYQLQENSGGEFKYFVL